MYKLGVVGLGTIFQYYEAAVEKNPEISLVAFCDKKRGNEISKKYKVPFYTDYRVMMDKQKLDAVVILTPNQTHYEIVNYALKKQIHVLCEKPLGITVSECERIARLAYTQKTIVMTAFHRRYNRYIVQLRKKIKATDRLQSIHVRYFEDINVHSGGENWYVDPMKSGGGCVLDNGINIFDLILDFVPDPVVESGQLRYQENKLEVEASIKLICKRLNARITVDLSWVSAEEIKDITITTSTDQMSADMLAGFPSLKGSLWHEYEGVVNDFVQLLKHKSRAFFDWRSLKAMQLVGDVYEITKAERLFELTI